MRGLVALLLLATGPALADDAPPRYRHRAHAERFDVQAKCTLCHASTENGRVAWPGADRHQPCAACHQEYRRPPVTAAGQGLVPRFCETCHVHGDPWRANPVRSTFAADSEFTVRFPHDLKEHRNAPCARCHPGPAGAPEPAPAPGHSAPSHRLCADCHQTLARPPMTDCGGCHVLAPADAPAPATGDDWRVGHRFDHATHRKDVRQAPAKAGAPAGAMGWAAYDQAAAPPAGCPVCHTPEAGDMGRPSMRACAACHDGGRAFKVTGFDCARCHLGPGHAL